MTETKSGARALYWIPCGICLLIGAYFGFVMERDVATTPAWAQQSAMAGFFVLALVFVGLAVGPSVIDERVRARWDDAVEGIEDWRLRRRAEKDARESHLAKLRAEVWEREVRAEDSRAVVDLRRREAEDRAAQDEQDGRDPAPQDIRGRPVGLGDPIGAPGRSSMRPQSGSADESARKTRGQAMNTTMEYVVAAAIAIPAVGLGVWWLAEQTMMPEEQPREWEVLIDQHGSVHLDIWAATFESRAVSILDLIVDQAAGRMRVFVMADSDLPRYRNGESVSMYMGLGFDEVPGSEQSRRWIEPKTFALVVDCESECQFHATVKAIPPETTARGP